MTPEQVRNAVVEGITDALANHPVFRHMLSAEQLRLIRAVRTYVATADAGEVARLAQCYADQPLMSPEPREPV